MNRTLSKPLTALLLKTTLTPNHVTFISLGFGVSCSMLLAQGTYAGFVWGAVCLEISMILDDCDGDIARAKNMKSDFGAWLDISVDLLIDILFFAGLALGVQRSSPAVPAVFLGSLCVAGSILNCLVVSMEKVRGFGPAAYGTPHPEGTKRDNAFFKIVDALREGDSAWFALLFAVIGKMDILLLLASVYMQILWLSAVSMNFKWLLAPPRKLPK